MPENYHAREHNNRNYDYSDGQSLPALLLLAFVVCEIEFLIIKLIHLAAYYIKTDCKFFVQTRRRDCIAAHRGNYAIMPLLMDVDHTNLLEALKHPETRSADPVKHEARMPPEHAAEPTQKEPRG